MKSMVMETHQLKDADGYCPCLDKQLLLTRTYSSLTHSTISWTQNLYVPGVTILRPKLSHLDLTTGQI